MTDRIPLASADRETDWLNDPIHRAFLRREAARQFAFFDASLRSGEGFWTLDYEGHPLRDEPQELHTTTRLVHSYALGKQAGLVTSDDVIDQGMSYLWSHHRDANHGGYVWALDDTGVADGRKLAYGHVFVLLAGASALDAGHPDARRLIDDVMAIIDRHFWEEGNGLLCDEYNRDWTPFSTYRGMNANMHGIEAMLTAFEATGDQLFLTRAGRILDFFVGRIAPAHGWRLPEHYKADWSVDAAYAGNPMFRPAGTTPGHSFELGRLLLQYWDLAGRPAGDMAASARRLIEQALADAWNEARGGFAYTLKFDGSVDNPNRYWWPVTEAIGAIATLMKLDPQPSDHVWYARLWRFAEAHLIDHARGGWFPELAADDSLAMTQFKGKPDIYHSVQAALFPLVPGLSRMSKGLAALTD